MISCFQSAMLAKHTLQEPNSLYARILHEKNFPEGTVLNAEAMEGICPCTWRSRLNGFFFFLRNTVQIEWLFGATKEGIIYIE